MRRLQTNIDLHVLYLGLMVFGVVSLLDATITFVPRDVEVLPVATFGIGVILFFTGPIILIKTFDRRRRRPRSGDAWSYLSINLLVVLVLGLLTTAVTYAMLPQK